MIEAILKILSAAATIAAIIIGDHTLAKWVAVVKLWWRQAADKSIREESDRMYAVLEREWNDAQTKKERQGGV